MKKHFIFIFTVHFLYSMEEPTKIRKPHELLPAYLPTAPSGQSYFTQNDIANLKTYKSLTTYHAFLKTKAYDTYFAAIKTVYEVTKTPNNNEDVTYKEAKSLSGALVSDHINWQSSSPEQRFHPLLFLKHPVGNEKFIIFDEKTWFDIAQGQIIQISPKTSAIQPQSKKKNHDQHKHSSKKQKLVQDGR